jgi:hypothetical protein
MKVSRPLDQVNIMNTQDCPPLSSGGLDPDLVVVQDADKPGAVCSECGRTVTEAEYSKGESNCCKAPVVPEEEY